MAAASCSRARRRTSVRTALGGEVLRRAMQPAGQDGPVRELPGIPRQGHEHTLRHVLGQVRIADHAHGGGIDQVNVPAHQFGKRRFGAALGVIAQKLLVGQTVHYRIVAAAAQIGQGKRKPEIANLVKPPQGLLIAN